MGHSNAFHSPYENPDSYILQLENPAATIEAIMDMYGDEIKRLIFTYMKNMADTDDVTQEVFVAVYQKISDFQGNSSLRSWIYSIAINKCKDHLRSWKSRNQKLREKLAQSTGILSGSDDTPEEYLLRKNEASQLLHQIMSLPIKYREVIILYYLKELTSKEISLILNVNDATVRTRLNRGREKLKQLLAIERGVDNG